MSEKEPIEINCPACKTRFRLWVPAHLLEEWDEGEEMGCVKCRARFIIKSHDDAIEVIHLKEKKPAQKKKKIIVEKEVTIEEEKKDEPTVKEEKKEEKEEERKKEEKAREEEEEVEVEVEVDVDVEMEDEDEEEEEDEDIVVVEEDTEGEEADEEVVEVEAEVEEASREKILFVDDDGLATALAQNELTAAGFDVVAVRSGEAALKKAVKHDFALIVTDLYLKDPDDPESKLDGDGLLRSLATLGKSLPAIVTTGKSIVDDMQLDPKWFDLKVKAFVQKGNPFWTEELKAKIKEVLSKR